MIELCLQLNNGIFAPYTLADQEAAREYKDNQIVKAKITAAQKPRSIKQLGTYWRLCKLWSDNSDRIEYATPALVDWRIRNALQFYDTSMTYVNTKTGQINFKVRSISFKNLKHVEACGYFDRALDLISRHMKVPLYELIRRADD